MESHTLRKNSTKNTSLEVRVEHLYGQCAMPKDSIMKGVCADFFSLITCLYVWRASAGAAFLLLCFIRFVSSEPYLSPPRHASCSGGFRRKTTRLTGRRDSSAPMARLGIGLLLMMLAASVSPVLAPRTKTSTRPNHQVLMDLQILQSNLAPSSQYQIQEVTRRSSLAMTSQITTLATQISPSLSFLEHRAVKETTEGDYRLRLQEFVIRCRNR